MIHSNSKKGSMKSLQSFKGPLKVHKRSLENLQDPKEVDLR